MITLFMVYNIKILYIKLEIPMSHYMLICCCSLQLIIIIIIKQPYFLVIKFLSIGIFFIQISIIHLAASNRNLNIYILYMITMTQFYLGTNKITNISNYLKSNLKCTTFLFIIKENI